MKPCPCGSGKTYGLCCKALITGEREAATPEELMRSRYTAYTLAQIDYIARTMKPPASTGFNAKEVLVWASQVKWLKLEVLAAKTEETIGTVEFCAYYFHANKEYTLHEVSEFSLDNERWYYIDGQLKT